MKETIVQLEQKWLAFWERLDHEHRTTFVGLSVKVGFLLLIFVAISRLIPTIFPKGLINYHDHIMITQALFNAISTKRVVLLLPALLILGVYYKPLLRPWKTFQYHQQLKAIVLTASFIVVWNYGTDDRNLYYNQWYWVDRACLLILFLLAYWRPIFLLPLIIVIDLFVGQFVILPGYFWQITELLLLILVLFTSFLVYAATTKRTSIHEFVFLLACLIASHYWMPATTKLNVEWIIHNEIKNFYFAWNANGWLSFLSIEDIKRGGEIMSILNVPMKGIVLLAEAGAVFFFLHRKVARTLLFFWMVLHLGIFFVSGVFFWMWLVMDVVLLVVFLQKKGLSQLPIFSRKHLVLAIFLIVTARLWCRPVALGWQDVKLSYTFRYMAEMENGETKELTADFFSPYDCNFTYAPFRFLMSTPSLPITVGGAKDAKTAIALRAVNAATSVLALEREKGEVIYNDHKAKNFDVFIQQYVGNWNNTLSKSTWFSALKAPSEVVSMRVGSKIEEKIKKVTVLCITTYVEENTPQVIREVPIREIQIPN